MLARYLGSKQAIMPELLATVEQHAEPGAHVVDAFSGSLAVSLGLKQAGYRVTANDINLFSAVLAEAYLLPAEPPETDAHALLPARRVKEYLPVARRITKELSGEPGYAFLGEPEWRARYENYLTVQTHLANLTPGQLPARHRKTHFFDTYCELGSNSAYESSRGAKGHRRFFTPENAHRIDLAVNQLRAWRRADRIDRQTYALLLANLMRAVEKVSNTQGTYHDFPRDRWDSRALRPLRFDPPALDPYLGGVGGHTVGVERDTLDFIGEVDGHSVLYIDPPYNFRQYTAYYFLPNVLCRYPEMDDVDEYFANVRYVRGQNPEDDFTSTFCKPKRFIADMHELIERAACRTVVISYFTGANHWSSFDTGPNDTGRELLSELLSGDLFEPGSLSVLEVPRRNYASYGGYTARTVHELLLVAEKKQGEERGTTKRAARRLRQLA